MLPPHLPAPSSNIKLHIRLQRLKVLFVSTAFGLLAGITGAIIVIGWIWPSLGEGDIWATNIYRTTLSKSQLAEQVARDLSNQTLAVYAKAGDTAGVQSFNPKDFIGSAAIVGNSDGWVVLFSRHAVANISQWRALSGQGRVYAVKQAIADLYAGTIYLKVADISGAGAAGEQFSAAIRFADSPSKLDDVFVFENGGWQRAYVQNISSPTAAAHLDSVPTARLILSQPFAAGSLVVASDGRLIGFVYSGNAVVSAGPIETLWPSKVVGKSQIKYPTLGAYGWFGDEQPIIYEGQRLGGFLVTQVVSKNSLLKRGDIITYISGQPMSFDNLWNALGGQTARLVVWRAGKTLEITTPVVSL